MTKHEPMTLNHDGDTLNLEFARKVCTLHELESEMRSLTSRPKSRFENAFIAAEREMDMGEWREFTDNILAHQDWLEEFSGLASDAGLYGERRPCIKVWCKAYPKAIIINTEGYDHARYTSLLSV